MIAVRWLVASSIRRPIPNWKSAAIEKPVKTPAERRGLQQHEAEDERRVSLGVVEVRGVGDRREAAGEGGEEEEREDQRRDQQGRVW